MVKKLIFTISLLSLLIIPLTNQANEMGVGIGNSVGGILFTSYYDLLVGEHEGVEFSFNFNSKGVYPDIGYYNTFFKLGNFFIKSNICFGYFFSYDSADYLWQNSPMGVAKLTLGFGSNNNLTYSLGFGFFWKYDWPYPGAEVPVFNIGYKF
jgi:hypothetical protein